MQKILIDTNAYSAFLKKNAEVLEIIGNSAKVFVSVFVLGEINYGFLGGTKEKQNQEFLERFLNKPTVEVINASKETATIFAFIKNNLKLTGKPIPENDIWIAAHALETGAFLLTNDKHFNYIQNLRILNFDL